MKISYRWLQEFVPVDLSPAELAEQLTMIGLPVDDIEDTRERFANVVVGKIEEIRKHPQADLLSLCRVTTGSASLSIVCGATNIAPGDKVPVALPGTKLPGGQVIKQSKIRGEISEGMLCSPDELQLGEDADSILILPPETPLGKELGEVLGLWDSILELDVTPNRSDCLSMLGIAREVAALTGQQVRIPALKLIEQGGAIEEYTSVTIEAPEQCPRYAARVITGVTVQPSPLWMQIRLLLLGLRPINNVVDVTNYVLMELGHPLHAFDYDRLQEHRIVVRLAKAGERCTTLDGIERALSPQMLVIADAQQAVAIAGVMGGFATEVTVETKNILLESAYFTPLSIRRTAKALDLHTEASHRFERGTDIEGSIISLDRAAELIRQIAGGSVAHGRADCYVRPITSPQLSIRVSRTNQVLGTRLSKQQIASYLRRLHLQVAESPGEESCQVKVPSFRPDLEREIDLIEEVARLYGYDNIASTLPQRRMSLVTKGEGSHLIAKAKEALLACGFYEIISYSFINEAHFDHLRLAPDDPLRQVVRLQNPLSTDATVMRTSLLPGLLETVAYNLKRENRTVALFEYGRVFLPQPGALLPHEQQRLAAVLSGKFSKEHWSEPEQEYTFYDIKGAIEAVLEKLGIFDVQYTRVSVPYLLPHKAATLRLAGQEIGVLGEVHPEVLTAFDISEPTWVFECNFDQLRAYSPPPPQFHSLPRYPALYRDMAVVVERRVLAGDLLREIAVAGGSFLRDISLFDVYEGEGIPPGKKSVAFSLVFRSDERTLTDKEVEKIYTHIVEHLQRTFGASLRGTTG